MAYQPWPKGQTYPALKIPLNVEGNADDITNLVTTNFTMILRNTGVAPASDTIGTGTFAIVTASPAVITYTLSASDVASVWTGSLLVKAVFSGGGIAIYDAIPFATMDD